MDTPRAGCPASHVLIIGLCLRHAGASSYASRQGLRKETDFRGVFRPCRPGLRGTSIALSIARETGILALHSMRRLILFSVVVLFPIAGSSSAQSTPDTKDKQD